MYELEVKALVEKVGREVARLFFSERSETQFKKDDSPLTEADLIAHKMIVEGLQDLSGEAVISEEDPAHAKVQKGKRYWLVDPIDGTRDFVAKQNTFVICVSLIEGEYPLFGLIHAPVTGKTWWAERGRGAFGPNGELIYNRSTRSKLIAAGSRSKPSVKMEELYVEFGIEEIIRFGSALKFCKVAEGEMDLYPRFGPTSEWDTAAGQIIAEEAGCEVWDLKTGDRLKYGKPDYLNQGGFIVFRRDLAPWVEKYRTHQLQNDR